MHITLTVPGVASATPTPNSCSMGNKENLVIEIMCWTPCISQVQRKSRLDPFNFSWHTAASISLFSLEPFKALTKISIDSMWSPRPFNLFRPRPKPILDPFTDNCEVFMISFYCYQHWQLSPNLNRGRDLLNNTWMSMIIHCSCQMQTGQRKNMPPKTS